MSTNLTWQGTATALSSISHGGDTRGMITLLRRETIITDNGPLNIPLISGNALRGRLRRTAETLTAEALNYRGRLTISAAAALRSGGALVKTNRDPISGAVLARLRELVPLIGVFGTAGAGRIIDGCLQVGKLMPIAAETTHLTGHRSDRSITELTQIETYARVDDTYHHDATPTDTTATTQTQFRIETFRAGTQFEAWLNLTNPTPTEAAFFTEVLTAFQRHATIAGRAAIGHGRLRFDLDTNQNPPGIDWQPVDVDEAIELLNQL